MKTHPAMEQPSEVGENPQPLALANSIIWRFLQMPPGGLYAKWDPELNKALWFYSEDRDYMFREPRCQTVLFEENDRSRFRSLIFRMGALADDSLCGAFEFRMPGSPSRKFEVRASFYPDAGIGLWIAITSKDEDGGANGDQSIRSEANATSLPVGSRR